VKVANMEFNVKTSFNSELSEELLFAQEAKEILVLKIGGYVM
jgi:hypothetical protein